MAPKDEPSSARMLNYDSVKEDPDGARDKRDTESGDLFRSIDDMQDDDDDTGATTPPSNEYVLNVALFSFIGFVVIQTVFALIAHSESMLADSQAMAVDAMTYLFNLCAERTKNHRPDDDDETNLLPKEVREYRRELRRLYLELVPPAISVITLITVTVMTLREAFRALLGEEDDNDADEDVSVTIMLLFSGANLLLDFINVTCFARANSTFGLNVVHEENESIRKSIRMSFALSHTEDSEGTALLPLKRHDTHETPSTRRASEDDFLSNDDENNYSQSSPLLVGGLVNLNMCSAWTHVCADTLRSAAVLLAATVAFLVPAVPGDVADSVAAIAVSLIILISLLPLLHGLVLTLVQIYVLSKNPPPSLS